MSKPAIGRLAIAAAIVASACGARPSASASWRVRFGPVLGNELIVGRVSAPPHAWVLTAGNALISVDLERGTHVRSAVAPLERDEHLWGLAATDEGAFWTLAARTVLAQFQDDGRVVRRVALGQPHVGVFGAGRELLFQVMDFQPPADALTVGLPGGSARRPWGGMRTRALPYSRTSVAALNLVSCGPTSTMTMPCWFPDQAVVTLIGSDGASHEVTLDGLPIVSPEILLASDNPRRPIRDALVAADGSVWILGSGSPPATEGSSQPGGWLLNRYDQAGRLRSRTQLPEPARLLLQAHDDVCELIAWDGRVVEVRP